MSTPSLTRRSIVSVLALLGAGLLAGSCIALAIGSARDSRATLLAALRGREVPEEVRTILIQVRLARVLLAVLTGAALASFFFSSRRRHTSCLSDWSSDVCSSDLRSKDACYDPLRCARGW